MTKKLGGSPRRFSGAFSAKNLTGETSALVAAGLIAQIIAGGGAVIVSRLSTPEALGGFATVLGIASILSSIVCLKYEQAIPVAHGTAAARGLTGLVLVLITFAVGLSIVAWWLLDEGPMPRITHQRAWFPFLPLFLAITGLQYATMNWAIRDRDIGTIAFARVGRAVATLIGQVGLTVAVAADATQLGLGYLAGAAAEATLLARRRRILFGPVPGLRSMLATSREFRRFPLMLAPANLLGAVRDNVNGPVIATLAGAEQAGYFFLADRLVSLPISVISQALGTTLFARLAADRRAEGHEAAALVPRLIVSLALLASVPAIIMFAAAPFAFGLVLGNEWVRAGDYSRAVIPRVYVWFCVFPVISTLTTHRGERAMLMWQVVASIAQVAALVVGDYLWGPLGAIWAASLTFVLVGFVLIGLVCHYAGVPVRRLPLTLTEEAVAIVGGVLRRLLRSRTLTSLSEPRPGATQLLVYVNQVRAYEAGQGRFETDIIAALRRRCDNTPGTAMHVISIRHPDEPAGSQTDPHLELLPLNKRSLWSYVAHQWHLFRALRRIRRAYPNAEMAIYARHNLAMIAPGLVARLDHIPVTYRTGPLRRGDTVGRPIRWWEFIVANTLLEWSIRGARAIIVVSRTTADWLRETFPHSAAKVAIVQNGVDTGRTRPVSADRAHWGLEEGHLALGIAGTLFAGQGVQTVIRAMARLADTRRPVPQLLVVGDGDYAPTLRQLAHDLGVRVVFTGRREPSDIPAALSAVDITLAPYPAFEIARSGASSLKVPEALACDRPVLASRCEDLQFLEEHALGWLVEPDDVDAWANAIEERRVRQDYYLNGRGRVFAEMLSIDHQADRFWRIAFGLPEDPR